MCDLCDSQNVLFSWLPVPNSDFVIWLGTFHDRRSVLGRHGTLGGDDSVHFGAILAGTVFWRVTCRFGGKRSTG